MTSFFQKIARALSPVSSAPPPVHPAQQTMWADGPDLVSEFFVSPFDTFLLDSSLHDYQVADTLLPLLDSSAPTDKPKTKITAKPDLSDCRGLEITFSAGQNHHIGYPFGLHSWMQLPWEDYLENDHFFLRARSCLGHVHKGSICRKCDDLRSNDILHGISEHIIHGINENTPLIFFPISGLVGKIRRKNDQIQVMRLTKHNDMQMLTSQSAALDSHKEEFVMAVCSGKVPRASRSTNEWLTTLPKHMVIQPLCGSPGMPTIDEIEENIDAYTVGEDAPTGHPAIIHRVVMMDQIAVKKRVCWDDKTNMILGACQEHSANVPLKFSDLANAEMFFQEFNAGKVHLASEATVVCFGALSRNPHIYNPQPICISGMCKHEKGPEQAALLRTVKAAGNNRKTHGNVIYQTVSFASDGEAKRDLALAMEFMKSKLDKTSPIYPLLAPLKFMNLLVGTDGITPAKDYRHVFKTTRGLLMRKVGIMLLGFLVTPAIVKQNLIVVHQRR
ncbi:hypothetical protein C8R44DRAFT_726003 [Mycena epipterygia]|nr:hypothetical protein C8R44DRAFT_726003 [Mycena epipterygia]